MLHARRTAAEAVGQPKVCQDWPPPGSRAPGTAHLSRPPSTSRWVRRRKRAEIQASLQLKNHKCQSSPFEQSDFALCPPQQAAKPNLCFCRPKARTGFDALKKWRGVQRQQLPPSWARTGLTMTSDCHGKKAVSEIPRPQSSQASAEQSQHPNSCLGDGQHRGACEAGAQQGTPGKPVLNL